MSNINNEEQQPTAKKKMSLEEAIKQKLASKKQNLQAGRGSHNGPVKTAKTLKSQQTKKVNNQRKRTGV